MRRIVHDDIDSTNLEALRLIARGDITGWTLVTARRQTAGRGRRGRDWSSPPGNLHSSFVVPMDGRAEWRRAWLTGFAAALAAHDTASAFVENDAPVAIKWPNDVLVGGRKLAGLLLERSGDRPFVVVGIGMNVAHHPYNLPYPATHLDAHRAAPAELSTVLDRLVAALETRVEQWLSEGFPSVRVDLLARTHQPGEMVMVRSETEHVTGLFVDIALDGQLVLDVGGAERRFAAGDVFPALRPP